jgi:hypothetical protein
MVEPKPLNPISPPYPPGYDANAKCDYHAGSPGHNVENCRALKFKVQELIDRRLLSFKEESPNVKSNPLPGHAGPSVNAVEEFKEYELIERVAEVKTPMTVVREVLIGYDSFEEMHSNCEICSTNLNACEKMKKCLQNMMDQGLVQIGYSWVDTNIATLESQLSMPIEITYQRRELQIPVQSMDPIVFHVPKPFPFESTNKVPWNYQPVPYVGGKPLTSTKPNVTNIVGVSGVTRSGRVFSPEQSSKGNTESPVVPAKEKGVEERKNGASPLKETIPQEEVEEFLRIIRKSDYKIVDQLGQTPSKISILSLLLSSEGHREALMKILNEAHVAKDISVAQFDGVVANITAGRYLGFSQDELPVDGHDHNRALHISVKCLDSILSRVLVDTGSSLNVMPKTTFLKLNVEGSLMRPSSLVVKAFDGSRRDVIGEVDLPILIGPQVFTITFQVMDIKPTYSCLLGRPWIHAAGAVTSTLHQKLKFITGDKMIVVSGQEDIMVSQLSSFQYIEADEEAIEVPFQALEIASVATVESKHNHSKRAGLALSSWKDMREALEEGVLEGWGKLPNIIEKKDRFGLGYVPLVGVTPKAKWGRIPTIQETFYSAGFSCEGQVAFLEDTDEDIPDLVYRKAQGEALNNWKATEIPQIISIPK